MDFMDKHTEIEKIYMGFSDELPPHYAYEAVQIFNDCNAFPEFVSNDERAKKLKSRLWLSQGDKFREVPFFNSLDEKLEHKLQKREMYKIMSDFTGYKAPWGCMTGVRPAKIVNGLYSLGYSFEEAVKELENFYMAEHEKAVLAAKVAMNQEAFLKNQESNPRNASIYIGIPFCPTRCLYCSFTSHPIEKYSNRVKDYLKMLEIELKLVIPVIIDKGYTIESLYIGGGTPTSLSEEDFATFMELVTEIVKIDELREFSLEAGRPDSITPAKLKAAKQSGVSRISVNPQTMNDKTLKLIGRRHSAKQIEKAFDEARRAGFNNINMDIIAGLPGEDEKDFEYTLDKISEMAPDAVTVHTLSVKRAADLKRDEKVSLLKHDVTGKMLLMAHESIEKMGMQPFYMYRQKNMLGNHENVSYCKPGLESPYNIHIMEEDQSIFAFGAGGVTKLCQVLEGERKITRSFNVKGVEDYMRRYEEMAERKISLLNEL